MGSMCEDAPSPVRSLSLRRKVPGAGKRFTFQESLHQLCEGWIGEDLFLSGSRAWVFSALQAVCFFWFGCARRPQKWAGPLRPALPTEPGSPGLAHRCS